MSGEFIFSLTSHASPDMYVCALDAMSEGSVRFAHSCAHEPAENGKRFPSHNRHAAARTKLFPSQYAIIYEKKIMLTLSDIPRCMVFVGDFLLVAAAAMTRLYAIDLANGHVSSYQQSQYDRMFYNRQLKFVLLGDLRYGTWELWRTDKFLETRLLSTTTFFTEKPHIPYANNVNFTKDGMRAVMCTRSNQPFIQIYCCITGKLLQSIQCNALGTEWKRSVFEMSTNTYVFAFYDNKRFCIINEKGEIIDETSTPFNGPDVIALSNNSIYIREWGSAGRIAEVLYWPCKLRKHYIAALIK